MGLQDLLQRRALKKEMTHMDGMRGVVCGGAVALIAFVGGAAPIGATKGVPIGDVRLYGPVADRMEAMIRNQVSETDPLYLSRPFHSRTEVEQYHSEFWGKYMHAAPWYWKYTGCDRLRNRIERGVKDMISTQTPDGYLGYYCEEHRLGWGTWDVWGCKYTLLGLITWYEVSGDKAALDAAVKLCDYMIRWFDPKSGHNALHDTGWVAGLASCSLMEPVARLYVITKEPRHLAFAKYILAECAVDGSGNGQVRHTGPDLIDSALKGVPVTGRSSYTLLNRHNRRKAYEMMSCYQGLLDYYEQTGDRRCFDAAVNTANDIITNETNLAGSGSVREYWHRTAHNQHQPYTRTMETCVTTTWMRFCQKLLSLTGDPKYADEIEKSFYNAYLAALKVDGSYFATYTPLGGYRSGGCNHCFMFTNCCNANGPRGFLVFLETLLRTQDDAIVLNFYNAAKLAATLPKSGRRVDLDMYTLYPKEGHVMIWNRTKGTERFALRLRVPAWSSQTSVKINGKASDRQPKPGSYFELDREWHDGDLVEIDFDLSVRRHDLDHAVAFTSGPILLARDNRFDDGDVGEVVCYDVEDANYATPWLAGSGRETPPVRLEFHVERALDPAMWMCWSARMPLGCHSENEDGRRFTTVRFCDFASAGNRWDPKNYYRTWLPVEKMPWD